MNRHHTTEETPLMEETPRAMTMSARQRKARRRGVTILETALIMPLLLFLTMGLVQYGIIMDTTNVLTNLARDGARYCAIHAFDGNAATSDAAVRAYIRQRTAGTIVPSTTIPDSSIVITVADRSPGQPYEIQINYSLAQKMFLPLNFMGFKFYTGTYTASSVVLIEGIN